MFSLIPHSTSDRVFKSPIIEGVFEHLVNLTERDSFSFPCCYLNLIKPSFDRSSTITILCNPLKHLGNNVASVWIDNNVLQSTHSTVVVADWRWPRSPP